jgi:hypothetical protein
MKKNRSFNIKTLARIDKEKKDFLIKLAVVSSEFMLFIIIATVVCGFVLFIGR